MCVCVCVHVSAANLAYYWTHQPSILLPIYDCVPKDLSWMWLVTVFDRLLIADILFLLTRWHGVASDQFGFH